MQITISLDGFHVYACLSSSEPIWVAKSKHDLMYLSGESFLKFQFRDLIFILFSLPLAGMVIDATGAGYIIMIKMLIKDTRTW